MVVRYAKLSLKSKVSEALLLGTFKIKLGKAIVGECKINSSASAGRQAQAIFIFNSSELAFSMIVSEQETKSVHMMASSRELCLHLRLALAILRHFAGQIYEEQRKNMRAETAFELSVREIMK